MSRSDCHSIPLATTPIAIFRTCSSRYYLSLVKISFLFLCTPRRENQQFSTENTIPCFDSLCVYQHETCVLNWNFIMLHNTSSNTRPINRRERRSVRMSSSTGAPICANGAIPQRRANASCSGVVVAKHTLALCNTCWAIYKTVISPEVQSDCVNALLECDQKAKIHLNFWAHRSHPVPLINLDAGRIIIPKLLLAPIRRIQNPHPCCKSCTRAMYYLPCFEFWGLQAECITQL